MKLAVIDADYPKPQHVGLAASWLRWHIPRIGGELCSPDNAEILLVTTTSQQQAPHVRHMLRKVRAGKTVIVGGAGAYGPAAFDGIADVVCVGEGLRFVNTLVRDGLGAAAELPEAWIPGGKRPVVPGFDFPWDLPPIMHPDGKYRVFESRGCRHKCLFCQTGWERPYQLTPDLPKLIRTCREMERRKLVYDVVTNDAGVTRIVEKLPGAQMASYRYKHLVSMNPSLLPQTVRIGVEGVSERLRRAVNKPVPTAGLVDLVHRLFAAGRTVRLFFIVGLPLEEASDYDELGDLINGIGRAEKGVSHFTFHAFIPQPASPLCVFPLADEYWDREESACRRFFDGDWFTRRVNWGKPAMYPTRLKNACNSMAASEAELRRGWWHDDSPNWRVQYLAPPWKMRHLAAVYARHLGRPDAVPDGVVTRP
uniref:Putative radical SAM superfamily protein n=1 Tax=viral metagenome TaxID=1070528 RepID=A0A6M3LKF9_9ZZZZ